MLYFKTNPDIRINYGWCDTPMWFSVLKSLVYRQKNERSRPREFLGPVSVFAEQMHKDLEVWQEKYKVVYKQVN